MFRAIATRALTSTCYTFHVQTVCGIVKCRAAANTSQETVLFCNATVKHCKSNTFIDSHCCRVCRCDCNKLSAKLTFHSSYVLNVSITVDRNMN